MYRYLATGLLALAALPAPASAETINCIDIRSLPAVISSQGAYCLTKDLSTSLDTGSPLTIEANNVTLDCNGYKIGGLLAGPSTWAFGILAQDRSNITIRNCNVRGFYVGIGLLSSSDGASTGMVVEDNRLDGNTSIGIRVDANASVVRRNQVTDTGGNPYDQSGAGIQVAYGTDVLDNTVDGVTPPASNTMYATGILSIESNGTLVANNRVRNIIPGFAAFGYANGNNGTIAYRGNVASIQNHPGSSTGFDCTTGTLVEQNQSIGFDTGYDNCTFGTSNIDYPFP